VNPLQMQEDRIIEATPMRKQQALEAGHGPRAPWLAAAVSGLLALALLSIAAGPVAIEAKAWLQQSLQVVTPDALSLNTLLLPAILCSCAVLIAAAVGQLLAHGGWLRIAAWQRAHRAGWFANARTAMSGWLLAIAAITGGTLAAIPWLGSLAACGERSLQEGLWLIAAFIAAAALGALIATLVLGLIQLRIASLAFDRTLRMTQAEAREANKDDAPRRAPRRRWRTA